VPILNDKRFFISALGMALLLFASDATPAFSQVETPSATSALKVGTDSRQIPAGTMLTIAFQTGMDSRVSNPGDPFISYITQDFTLVGAGPNNPRKVVLPAGTAIRGRVSEVKRPFLFSHGGSLGLSFDHVMLPSGDLMPITLNLSADNTMVNKKGVLYSDPGIGRKVGKGVEEGKKVFSGISERGMESGKRIAGGFGTIVTVPASIVGGAVAGTAVTTGKAAVAVVGKGDSMVIQPGDTMTIDFGGTFNLPAE
jgi:hypothetical protein